MKLFGARVVPDAAPREPPGDGASRSTHTGMTVACGHGAVQIAIVHPAGKRRIAPEEWARGRGISPGERLF